MGNLLRRRQDGRAHRVRRDPEGRILGAWSEGQAERYDFAHDADGERIAPVAWDVHHVSSITCTLRDEGGNVLSHIQWSLGGGWSRKRDRFYLGHDEQVRVEYNGTGVDRFITTARGHLGSARAEIYGWDHWRTLDLWPCGEIRTNTPHNPTQPLHNGVHLFTSHEPDWLGTNDNPRKGEDSMHARHFNLHLGRFLSTGPIGRSIGSSQSWSRYSYVLGHPINATDPTGTLPLQPPGPEDRPRNVELAGTTVTAWDAGSVSTPAMPRLVTHFHSGTYVAIGSTGTRERSGLGEVAVNLDEDGRPDPWQRSLMECAVSPAYWEALASVAVPPGICPDYVCLTASIGLPASPLWGAPIGLQFSLLVDKDAGVFLGPGVNVGRTPTLLSFSAVEGVYDSASPALPIDLTISVGGGVGFGGNRSFSLFGSNATEIGLFTPQAGVSFAAFVQVP